MKVLPLGTCDKLITEMFNGKFDGCIQLEETYPVDSDEAMSTVIFLDGIYQNRAVYANAKNGMVRRAKLKKDIKDYTTHINPNDVIFKDGTDEIELEDVKGAVQIICCSDSMLKLINKIARHNKL